MNNRSLLVVAALSIAACSDRGDRAADSSLASDLALASQMQATSPTFRDTAPAAAEPRAVAQAPARIDNAPRTRVIPRATESEPAPTPAPAPVQAGAAEPAARTIDAGTSFALSTQQRICTATNRPGDRFVATLINPVTGVNGAVIPAGAAVVLEVASLTPGATAEATQIGLRVHSVDFNGMSYRVQGDVQPQSDLERQRIVTDPNADKKKVVGGAIAGAIIGQMIGKNTKGTVIGAAAGAATGAVAAKATEKWEGCLPSGAMARLVLTQPVVL